MDLIENCEFDTIYHEHLFYHTLHGLTRLFKRHGLYLNEVERLPIHGGSLRLTVSRTPARSEGLDALFAHETALGVNKVTFYNDFADRVRALRDSLGHLLVSERAKRKRIACYGAAAKGATLVNYLNLGEGFFEFVADATPTSKANTCLDSESRSDIRMNWRRPNRTMSCSSFGIRW